MEAIVAIWNLRRELAIEVLAFGREFAEEAGRQTGARLRAHQQVAWRALILNDGSVIDIFGN